MSTDATERNQEVPRPQSGELRVYAPPAWLTRRFVIWALISIFTIGPVPVAFVMTAVDQWLRNIIDDLMSGPDMYKSLSLGPKEYLGLPLHWRQVLAEISVRPETAEMAATRELIKTLTPEQIELVDQIAPYVVDGFLVRDRQSASNHPIPGLSLVDFETLEDLGILQNVREAYTRPNQPINVPMVMSGKTAALKIRRLGQEGDVSLRVTRLTEMGSTLVGLLRVPSDIQYFEWIARKIDGEGVNVTVWATGPRVEASVQIQRDSVSAWP